MSDTAAVPNDVGVINPFALAEVVLKRKVNWQRVNSRELLEKTLGTAYEKLFDPKFGSPLYPGVKLNPQSQKVERAQPASTGAGQLKAMVDVGGSTVWVDPGDFFEECTELTDPVQGAVADCYFIAALASVAWARPYVIAQRTRATGTGQNQFFNMIEFHNAGTAQVEVSELLPLNAPGNTYIYARSSEAGEIWPAVYEKAYAKWKTNHTGDQPDIPAIAYGDPVGAAAQLTGLAPSYFSTSSMTADAIYQKVRENSLSRKTFNPMVAWTYPSGDASPDKVNYGSAHLVANHAYSILGWDFINNQQCLILRNPWGSYESTIDVPGGSWVAFDGFWRSIDLAPNDGIFALRADTFKKYFAGFGVVK